MTAISMSVEIVEDDVRRALDLMVGAMDRPQGFYRNVGEHLLRATARRFEEETSPEGTPWARLRPSTVRQRERRRQTPITILRATRRTGMAASINYRAGEDVLEIGVPSGFTYAAIHQLGGTIERAARTARIFRKRGKDGKLGKFAKPGKQSAETEVQVGAHTITIPARPFLGVSAEDERIILTIAADWLDAAGGQG